MLIESFCTGNLHERVQREGRLRIACVPGDRIELDELEIVEALARSLEVVVEVLHHLPGAVADAHHHDRERPLGGLHDRRDRVSLVRHLAISHNHQDMVLQMEWQENN